MNKKLLKNSLFFVFGEVLNKSIPFLLLPILTRYLTPEDYGVIAIFNVLISIFAVFTGVSIHGAVNVYFFKMKKQELNQFIGNCLLILSVSTLITFFITYLLNPFILDRLIIEKEWLFIAILIAFAQFLTTINLTLWMSEEKPKPYSVYQISQTLTITLIALVLIVGFGMNWEGRLLSITIGTLLFSAISLLFIIKRGYFRFKLNSDHIKDALKFGIPLIPHQLSSWIKTGLDRIIIIATLGTSITGLYSVGYQIALVINVLVFSFNQAWIPYLNKTLANEPTIEDKEKIVKFTYLYFVLIFVVSIVFSYCMKKILPYFLGIKFMESFQFIPYFSISFAFTGMYYMVTNYIFYTQKTYLLSIVTLTVSMIHFCLLYVLTNLNGAIGAAQASLVSFFITFLITWYLASKVYKMPWKIWKTYD